MLVIGAQAAHDKVAVLQRREADADRQVKPLAQDVDAAIGAFQLHLDPGVIGQKPRDHRPDLKLDQRGWAGHADQPLRFLMLARDDGAGGIGLDQHGGGVAMKFAPEIGDRKGPRRAMDQPDRQLFLQLRDPATDPGTRHAKLARRRRKTPRIDDMHEQAEIIQVRLGHWC